MPTIEAWLQGAVADATRHAGDGVRPVLEALAGAAAALRRAAWNAEASRDEPASGTTKAPPTARRG